MTRVFISSTSLDLKAYRQAAREVCAALDFDPVMMEDFEAMGVGATEGSKRKLNKTDLYVGIVAHRYGYIENGYPSSVTEIEFDYAGERNLERLCFLVDPTYNDWPTEHIDNEHFPQLRAFKSKIETQVIRQYFTNVEDFRTKLRAALFAWQEERESRRGEIEAIFTNDADDIIEAPPHYVGREKERIQIHQMLDQGKRVLLQGLGGSGKTALAATVVVDRINSGEGPVLWLNAGTASRDALYAALARPFGGQQTMAVEAKPADKARVIRALLKEHGVRLLVLDDVWNSQAITQVLNALPSGLPVLVTSRQRFPGMARVDIGKLDRNASMELMSHYAGRELDRDSEALALCKLLADHPFALRLAGLTMAQYDLQPRELLRRLINSPLDLEAPQGVEDDGPHSIRELMQVSLRELEARERETFLAYGAFFTTTATPVLLAYYLKQPPNEVESALQSLQLSGLVERISETEDRVAEYRLHDLAYMYVKDKATDEQRNKGLDACVACLATYHEPLRENFRLLRTELDNFVGAANWAMAANRYIDVMLITNWLYRPPEADAAEGFLSLQGYASLAIQLLNSAVQAAKSLGMEQEQAGYLGNLGSAYRDLGQLEEGVKYYEQALAIARALDDDYAVGLNYGRLGIVYRLLDKPRQAIELLEQGLGLMREVGNRRWEGIILSHLGSAHRDLNEYERTVEYYEMSWAIASDIGDKRGEGIALRKLGTVYRHMGQLEQSIHYLEEARKIAFHAGYKRELGITLGNLGMAYKDKGDLQGAVKFMEDALDIARDIGDRRSEAISLGNLSTTNRELGRLDESLKFAEDALTLARDGRDALGESISLGRIGDILKDQGKLRPAFKNYQQAMALAEQSGNQRGQAINLGRMGDTLRLQGKFDKAKQVLERGLMIARQIKDQTGEAIALTRLGDLAVDMQVKNEAVTYYKQARELYEDMNQMNRVLEIELKLTGVGA